MRLCLKISMVYDVEICLYLSSLVFFFFKLKVKREYLVVVFMCFLEQTFVVVTCTAH